jgi:hypothetical protein
VVGGGGGVLVSLRGRPLPKSARPPRMGPAWARTPDGPRLALRALLLSPIDAKTSDGKTPSNVLNCVLQGMAGMQQKPLGAVRTIKKVIVLSAIFKGGARRTTSRRTASHGPPDFVVVFVCGRTRKFRA